MAQIVEFLAPKWETYAFPTLAFNPAPIVLCTWEINKQVVWPALSSPSHPCLGNKYANKYFLKKEK